MRIIFHPTFTSDTPVPMRPQESGMSDKVGSITAAVRRDIRDCVTLHQDELLVAWEVINVGGVPNKFPPLR